MTHNSVLSRHLTVTYVGFDLTLAQRRETIKASLAVVIGHRNSICLEAHTVP